MTGDASSGKQRGIGWWVKRIVIMLLTIPAVLLGISFLNGQLATARDQRDYPPPGEIVALGDHNLHIHCLGEGSPTVILEAGANSWSVVWTLVQEEIAETSRVCSYDRAGLGWSEPGSQPRTARQIVDELHTLLVNAGVEGPYIMLGHSFGGPLVRVFADQYPAEVVGVVLVDSAHPDQATRLPVAFMEGVDTQIKQFEFLGRLARLGILRFGIKQNVPTWTLPDEVLPAYFAVMSRPEYYEASVAEASALGASMQQTRETSDLGDRPLIVLTAGQLEEEMAAYPGVDEDLYKAARRTLQEDLAALSTNSRFVVAEESGHIIQLYQPELVIDAVRQVVEMCRAE